MILATHASAYAYNNSCNTIIRVFTAPHNKHVITAVVAGHHCALHHPTRQRGEAATTLYIPLYRTGAGYRQG